MNHGVAVRGEGSPRVLTVGHSTHPIHEFLALLRGAGVTLLVDVRALPGSRRNPQFDEERLEPSLSAAGIAYLREERLGGRRPATRGIAVTVNGFWENQSFHRYADYALGTAFADGLDRLVDLAVPPELPVIMCSEAVWWRCHRRIIADHLIVRGLPVAHLMPDGRLTPATLTTGARPQADGTVTYPGGEPGQPRQS